MLLNTSVWRSFEKFCLLYQKWLTYTTFRSSVCVCMYTSFFRIVLIIQLRIWACSRRCITKIKGTIRFLSSNCIWMIPCYCNLWNWKLDLFAWPWPDLDYELPKIVSHDPMDSVIEFLVKVDQEICDAWPMCDWKFSRLVWPSFDLQVY